MGALVGRCAWARALGARNQHGARLPRCAVVPAGCLVPLVRNIRRNYESKRDKTQYRGDCGLDSRFPAGAGRA